MSAPDVLSDETVAVVAEARGSDAVGVRLAREVLRLRRRLQDAEQRYHDGRVQRACLAALTEPGTVADVSTRLGWSYRRARAWVHHLHHAKQIMRVGTVRTASGQHAGTYVVAS